MNRAPSIGFAGLALLALATISGSAHAEFRLVPSQHSTIQSAVDASAPGDTLWVFSGEYRENVYIDVDDLSIRGMCLGADSRAIVDGGTGGDVFHVAANNVSFRCLTLRHGETGIYAEQGIAVASVQILSSDGHGIYIESGDEFLIQNTEIVGSSSIGIYVNAGQDGEISNTIVRGSDDDCYYLDYVDGLKFFGNQGVDCTDYALEAYGEGMQIRENAFKHNGGGVYVSSDNNTIDTNSIIDSAHTDDGLYVDGDNNTIENNEVHHCYYDCLSVYGDGIVIRDNVLTGSTDDYCMDLDGTDMVVVGNECRGQNYYGLYLYGDSAEIRDNTIDGAQYTPIYVSGDDATVSGNTIRNSYDGVYVDGANAAVESNDVSATTYYPIYVSGDDPRVIDNLVGMGQYESIEVDCGFSCDSAEISGNTVDGGGSGGGYSGVYVDSGPGTVIRGNTVRNVQGYGFELDCDECTISSNVAIENGGYDGYRAGFYIDGDDSVLSGNRAVANTGPGFRIRGDRNTLEGNEASRNLLEGIRIDAGADDNTLSRNVTERNHAEGIDNHGESTELTSNVSSNNRTDCTDDGSMATNVGNSCEDESNFSLGSSID